jgi:HEAT repeat protein
MAFEWPGRVDRLARELERGDVEQRKAAVRQLGQHAPATSEAAILIALEDDDTGVRVEAAEAAARAGVRKAAPILVDWLHSPDAATRRAAVAGLGQLREASALPDLVRALGDASPEVRVAAVGALQSLGAREGGLALIGRLEDGDSRVRTAAIAALAALRDERAVMPLLTQLLDPAGDVASRAAGALGAIGDARAAAALVQALKSSSTDVRIAAASALGDLAQPSSVPALETAAGDTDGRVARAALAALGRIEDTSARAALLAKLDAAVLGEAARDALVQQARLLSSRAALDAARVDAARAQLLDGLTAKARVEGPGALMAVDALSHIARVAPIDAAAPALAELLGAAAPALQASLIGALGACDAEVARTALLEQLVEPAPAAGTQPSSEAQASARRTAVLDGLLAQLGRQHARGTPDGRAADPLLDRLGQAQGAEVVKLIALLGLTAAERAQPAIEAFLTASQPELRLAAARALGQITARASAAALLVRLDDEHAGVRREAAQALRGLADAAAVSTLLDMLQAAGRTRGAVRTADRDAMLVALSGALARLRAEKALPNETAVRALRMLTGLIADADIGIADRAVEALATWGPTRALAHLGRLLRTPSSRQRAVITSALGRFAQDEARIAIRYVLDQGGERAAVAAAGALAELGDQRDLAALVRVAERKHWPLPSAAAYGIARIAMRGAIKPHMARRALCKLGRAREPYVRANVAAALAVLAAGPCEDEGPDPVRWLEHSNAAAVRVAAARWARAALAQGRLGDGKSALTALERCARSDVDPLVRAACEGERTQSAQQPLVLHARALDADGALADRLIAVRFPSGAVLIGYSDHNGMLYTPAGPSDDAQVVLENPATARLEAPELAVKAPIEPASAASPPSATP